MEDEIREIVEEFRIRISCSKRSSNDGKIYRKTLLNNGEDDVQKLELLMEAAMRYVDLCD